MQSVFVCAYICVCVCVCEIERCMIAQRLSNLCVAVDVCVFVHLRVRARVCVLNLQSDLCSSFKQYVNSTYVIMFINCLMTV